MIERVTRATALSLFAGVAGTLGSAHAAHSYLAQPLPATRTAGQLSRPAQQAVAAMVLLDHEFLDPRNNLYVVTGGQAEPEAALWPTSQALAAAIAVARITHAPVDLARVRRIITALKAYRSPTGGYHARVVRSLRYYDDNNWIALDLLDAAQLLNDSSLLAPVTRIFAFLVSGWDAKQGGGIFWADGHPDRPTVSTAPAITIGLRLAAITHNPYYRNWAARFYAWMNAVMRAPNGLYYDHIDGTTGKMDKDFVSYNQGVMIQANVAYAALTGQSSYLRDAAAIARAAAHAFPGPWRDTGNYAAFDAIYFQSLRLLDDALPGAADLAPVRAYVNWAWPVASRPRTVLSEDAMLEQAGFVLSAAAVS